MRPHVLLICLNVKRLIWCTKLATTQFGESTYTYELSTCEKVNVLMIPKYMARKSCLKLTDLYERIASVSISRRIEIHCITELSSTHVVFPGYQY